MYKHILVPIDGSPLSIKAVKTASKLASQLGARLTTFYVIPPYTPPMAGDGMSLYITMPSPEDYKKRSEKHAAEVLEKAREAASEDAVEIEGVFATEEEPWDAIIKAARSRKCDLIVMSSHGRRGLAGILLGSETHKVLTHSKTPVLVCR